MMGKTHVSVGIATTLLVMTPSTVGGCATAITGGAVGGIISDIEVRSNAYMRDALDARIIATAIAIAGLLVDLRFSGPMTTYLTDANMVVILAGLALTLGTSIFGRFTKHRTFTHSFLALGLLTAGVAMACLPLALPFAIGFVTHLVLDLLNKKPLQLLYPLKVGSFCLGLFYANGKANKVFLGLGIFGSAIGLGFAALGMI